MVDYQWLNYGLFELILVRATNIAIGFVELMALYACSTGM
jgi:hypothetical protein